MLKPVDITEKTNRRFFRNELEENYVAVKYALVVSNCFIQQLASQAVLGEECSHPLLLMYLVIICLYQKIAAVG